MEELRSIPWFAKAEAYELFLRAMLCAVLSATIAQHIVSGQFWGAGVAYAAIIILPLAGWRPWLLLGVAGAYALNMWFFLAAPDYLVPTMDWLERNDGLGQFIFTYLRPAFLGSIALSLVLWSGGLLSRCQVLLHALIGIAMGSNFFLAKYLLRSDAKGLLGDLWPTSNGWVWGYWSWQFPMAYLTHLQMRMKTAASQEAG